MKVLFSSWRNNVVDNRGKPAESWADCPGVELSVSFTAGRAMTAFMGWSGFVALSEAFNVVEMAHNYSRALKESSCGRCFPCRIGTSVMEGLLGKIAEGSGTKADLEELSELCNSISQNSKCGIGQLGPNPISHTLKYFYNDYLDCVSGKKSQIKNSGFKYPYKMTAPCTSACPTGMDIPRYIELIKDADYAGSLETIRRASPMAATLGRACFHPCEDNCRRTNVDSTLSICKLKRVAWDWENLHEKEKPANPLKHARTEKVAVIGGGPSGLSCAYYLALEGYRVTVFEKLNVLGGAAHTGIPQYRIPKEILGEEVDYLRSLGVEIKTGVNFGKDETFKSLRGEGYKAFFLATGGDLSKKMRVDGEFKGYEGLYKGIEILKKVVLKETQIPTPERVLVVGGGNTAMDCVRTFIRLGCKDVNIVYRRTEKELPADPVEVRESIEEGVKYKFLLAPTKIVAKNGRVAGLECQKMELGPPDDSGRQRPVPIEGSKHVVEADCVISAIGQDCDIFYLDEEKGVEKTKWSTITVNEETMQTNVPDIFAGGDVVTGPLTLVTAAGQGRRAAQGIDQYIKGVDVKISDEQVMEKIISAIGAYDGGEKVPQAKGLPRASMPIIDHDKRVGSFSEVETGYPPDSAMREAERCMRCYIIGMACVVPANGGKE